MRKVTVKASLTALVSIVLTLSFFSHAYAQRSNQTPPLRPIQQNGKWGYIDSTGKIVIKPQFVWAEEFSEGLASFQNEDGKHGYIDESGTVVIEPKYDSCTDFSEGLAAVSLDFGWGYIDKTGNWAIQPKFAGGRPFSDGLALVGMPLDGKVSFPPGPEDHVFIDKTGKVVVDPKDDILNGTFSEGVGTVQLISKTGVNAALIDKTGNVIIGVQEIDTDGFSEALVPAKQNGKWGYLDPLGKFAIEPQFKEVRQFSEGLAPVLIGEKWGFIDHGGQVVIAPKYDVGYDRRNHNFSEGLALVYFQDKCVYINKTGKILISVQCSDAGPFSGGIASIKTGEEKTEKRGYINKAGKFIWGPAPFKYQSTEEISAREEKDEKDEEVLTPLTAEERALDPREVILNQPDFVADLTYFVGEGFGGHGGAERLVRKGNRYREESQFWIFIGEIGKPSARVFAEAKSYDDFESERGGSADTTPLDPRALAKENDVRFTALGTRTIDGHNCLKIQAVRKGKPEKFYFYAARDLKNLVIVVQLVEEKRGTLQRLVNISLDVPDSLVQIPADYKPIEHDRWVKLENAKVTYGGKPSKDFVVFRAPAGELFVHVNDAPYAWDYLVRPQLATVETAFQGLIVTRSGNFIWETKDTEGFSQTWYREPKPLREWDNPEDRRVIVKPNSVKFRSNDYKKDKAMIEVQW